MATRAEKARKTRSERARVKELLERADRISGMMMALDAERARCLVEAYILRYKLDADA